MDDGTIKTVKIESGNSRFSIYQVTHGDREARFYRNASDKYYVAALRGVRNVARDDVDIETAYATPKPAATATKWSAIKAMKTKPYKLSSSEIEDFASAVVSAAYPETAEVEPRPLSWMKKP